MFRLTESGLTQGLHKTRAKNRSAIQSAATIVSMPMSNTKTNVDDFDGDDEEKENLIGNRESSHEYD